MSGCLWRVIFIAINCYLIFLTAPPVPLEIINRSYVFCNLLILLVPRAGIEPAWCYHRGILNPLRLPVSPPGLLLEAEAGIGPAYAALQAAAWPLCHTAIIQKKRLRGRFNLERETRFELATPTLARLCSTTELFPHLHASAFYRKHRDCQHLFWTFFHKLRPCNH